MPTRERAVDRGTLRGRQLIQGIGIEIRNARLDRGLSLRSVATAAGISESQLSRVERGLVANVGVLTLARLAAIVGLDLSCRAYPTGAPIRDTAQIALVGAFAALLHPSLRWRVEVPMPEKRDLRRWDGMVSGTGWRYGVEGETAPRDAQAVARRLEGKARDSGVDGVILVVRDTRQTRAFMAGAGAYLAALFPVAGTLAVAALRRGDDPGGSAIVVIGRTGRPTRLARGAS